MQKEWKVLPKAPESFIKEFPKYHPIIAQLLYNRGLQSQSDIDRFFNPDYEKLHDPFLFRDMNKAAERVWRAIDKKEKIMIHGDYDADGVTSSATMYRPLKVLGADVGFFIPHRERDGYGLNMKTVEDFIVLGVDLVITVDCGITNVQEVERLQEAGIDVIITDHHEPMEILPAAYAILDPKVKDDNYPFLGLSGAAVAYKLVQALFADKRIKRYEVVLFEWGGPSGFLKWMLDIVAIGVVADVMPLVDENRILVKWGLLVLNKSRNVGLQKLFELIRNTKVDSFTIGFQIAPRLNAAGRMDHAKIAFNLLTAENQEEAEKLAWRLQELNLERQRITESAVNQAKEQVLEQKKQSVLFAYHKEWPAGIIGLIAGRLSEEFYRPVVVMTESNTNIVGSGRSVEGYNITQGLVSVAELFQRFGGHSQACGFTLTQIEVMDDFREKLNLHANNELKNIQLQPTVSIDGEIAPDDIGLGLLNQLEQFEPFGEVNSKPQFLVKNLDVVALDRLGQDGRHLRLMVKHKNPKLFKMMKFNGNGWLEKIRVGVNIDAVVELGKNEWNGRVEPEFKIVDLKLNNK